MVEKKKKLYYNNVVISPAVSLLSGKCCKIKKIDIKYSYHPSRMRLRLIKNPTISLVPIYSNSVLAKILKTPLNCFVNSVR